MGLMVLRPSLRASHGGYKKLSSLSVSLPVVAQLCLVCLLLGYLLHQPALEHQVTASETCQVDNFRPTQLITVCLHKKAWSVLY